MINPPCSIFELSTQLYPAYFLPLASLGNLAKVSKDEKTFNESKFIVDFLDFPILLLPNLGNYLHFTP